MLKYKDNMAKYKDNMTNYLKFTCFEKFRPKIKKRLPQISLKNEANVGTKAKDIILFSCPYTRKSQ